MHLRTHALPLPLRHPFRIAHGTSTQRNNLLVTLTQEPHTGYGEGALPPYYPTTLEDARQYLGSAEVLSILNRRPFFLEDTLARLPPGPSPAVAALDLALHDLWGKQLGYPLYQLWGLNPMAAPPTMVTLSFPADEGALEEALDALPVAHLLKLKLGVEDAERDLWFVQQVAQRTPLALCVDVNGGWSIQTAATMIRQLEPFDLAFIEQPIEGKDPDEWHYLDRMLPLQHIPLFADESLQGVDDIVALAGAAQGINIKLMKAGGLHQARHQIAVARALDLQVMVGCMIESAVATTAAAHLAPLVDYVDLDATLHLETDPFQGLTLSGTTLCLPEAPGLGVTPQHFEAF